MRTGFEQPVPTFLVAPDTAHNRELAVAYGASRGISRALAMETWDPEATIDRGLALDRARSTQRALEAAAQLGTPSTMPVWGPDDVGRTAAQAIVAGAAQAAEAVRLLGDASTPVATLRSVAGSLLTLVNQATHQLATYSWDVPRGSIVLWTRPAAGTDAA